MSLVKTSFLNGIAVAVKVATAVLINKILAVYVGPAGYAVLGQFQNALAVAASLAGGVIAPGVTKSTAEHFYDEVRQHAVWQTAVKITLIATAITCLILVVANTWIANVILNNNEAASIILWAAFALPAITANNLLLAILNGKKQVGIYIGANILSSIFGLCIIGIFTAIWGLYGAMIALAINPAVALLCTGALTHRLAWFKVNFLWGKTQLKQVRELSQFGIMGITTALTAPLTYMLIREYLTTTIGLNSAGYWQASWKISEVYLMLVTTTLSVYYLPRLAEIKSPKELRNEIIKVYRLIMPIVIVLAVAIYGGRELIIQILFSSEFMPMKDLFMWQLAGDVLKIGSWIISFILMARAMVRQFVYTEIAFSILFYILTREMSNVFGLTGVSMAYAFSYLVYWVVVAMLIRKSLIDGDGG